MATKKTSARKKAIARTKSFPIPPVEFDYASADEDSLREYGLDHIPRLHSDIVEGFQRAMATPTKFIKPRFRRHSRRQNATATPALGNQASGNWSGAFVNAPAGSQISSAAAQWSIPNFATSGDGVSACSIWVGIDGYGSNDVFQAGVECDLTGGTNGIQSQLFPWYEWAPDGVRKITNLKASVGDEIYCLITAVSSTIGRIFLKNMTSSAAVNYQVSAPASTQLQGNCAEWIVEAPAIDGDPDSPLCNYGSVQFSGCTAAASNASSLTPSDGTGLYMERDGQVFSTSASPAPGELTCTYKGPVL
jgi:hypothetical protein